MRISRPCYDKPSRCPGWAGGGMRYARKHRCENGRINGIYDKKHPRWRFNRCDDCGVIVLPMVIEYVDWRFWHWKIRGWWR